jgi:hypothetical protein
MTGPEWISFDQVQVGDELTFLTADNGFGGSGGAVSRTGTVFRKTDKVIGVRVGDSIPVFRDGKSRIEGATARLRRADWSSRSPRRIRLSERVTTEGGAQ